MIVVTRLRARWTTPAAARTAARVDAPAILAGSSVAAGAAAPRRRHLLRRAGIIGAASAVLFGLGAGIASAHVTVNPNTTAAGSYAKLTFRVPTESATASTVSLTVSLPTDHPFPTVSLMPVPGWTASTHTAALNPPVTEGKFDLTQATDSVTWRADDGVGVKPGEFMEFSISVGPVPDVPSMVFPAKQTYSDGSVVAWDQVASGGSQTLDHPAPTLTITPAGTAPGTAAASGTDTTTQVLAAIALVIAAIALLLAVIGLRRRPKPARSAAAAPSEARPPAPAGVSTSSSPEDVS